MRKDDLIKKGNSTRVKKLTREKKGNIYVSANESIPEGVEITNYCVSYNEPIPEGVEITNYRASCAKTKSPGKKTNKK